jgi:Polysaccharide lyase
MTIFSKKIILVFVVLLLTITSCKSQVNVYDGFETSELSKIWAKDRMISGALEMQSTIVRNGHGAAKMTLKTGDVFEAGIGKSKDSERDELREADKLVSVEEKLYEYGFSLFLPDSFPIVPVRLVIAQWKQYCGSNSICSDDSPVMAIRYVNGKLYITIQTDLGEKVVYKTTEEVRNKWLDFKFKVRFSRLDKGQVDAWLNEKQIINFKGITCYSSKKGYTEKSYFYFKTGLYRDIMPQPMTIYIDEYSKKELSEQ